jgi:hypothetical protein
MGKGPVTAYAQELGVWVTLKHVRNFGWNRSSFDNIGSPASHVHRMGDAPYSCIVAWGSVPTVDQHACCAVLLAQPLKNVDQFVCIFQQLLPGSGQCNPTASAPNITYLQRREIFSAMIF